MAEGSLTPDEETTSTRETAMSMRKVPFVLAISAVLTALGACSNETASNVIAGPGVVADVPPVSPTTSVTHNRGFVWSPESGIQLIPQPANVESMWLTGINNQGQVIGDLIPRDGTEDFRAFIWSANDGLQRLGSLLGADGISRALTIDDDGEVRGLSEGPSTTYFIALHLADAFVWTREAGMKETNLNPLDNFKPVAEGGKLILPSGANCMKLVHATTTGLAVGYAGSTNRGTCKTWLAVMWQADGSPIVITGCEPRCASVSDINNRGEVVGYMDGGFSWTRSGGLVRLPIDVWPLFVNDNGDAAGLVPSGEPSAPFVNPFVLMASGEIKTIDLPRGTTSVTLAGINNKGQVVGTFH
jgi:uncharacterized membrane protein